jgi:hypothetical protein
MFFPSKVLCCCFLLSGVAELGFPVPEDPLLSRQILGQLSILQTVKR